MSQTIDPIRYSASYRLAADQIRRAIELGTYLPGDRLPASRELARQLGISVATLREAVRGLIDEGIVEMRRGPKGGLVVQAPPTNGGGRRVSKALVAEFEMALELRDAVEPYAAGLAAQRRTDADLARLERSYAEMAAEMDKPEDGLRAARFHRADSAFHGDIVRAARNELLLAAVEEARVRMFTAVGAALRELADEANTGHDQILREIRRGRPEAAAKAMRAHLETTGADAREMIRRGAGRRR